MKKQISGLPWSLQRVVFDELWQDTKGKGVRVAVIDTGVDRDNPQLTDAVDRSSGLDLLPREREPEPAPAPSTPPPSPTPAPTPTPSPSPSKSPDKGGAKSPAPTPGKTPGPTPKPTPRRAAGGSTQSRLQSREAPAPAPSATPPQAPPPQTPQPPVADASSGDGTTDLVGHGTKVAGIIAARPREGTGFVGLAPESTIIPIRQNDEKGTGTTTTLAAAIRHAIREHARVINISQDTTKELLPDSELELAVREALDEDIVVVASAGNDGLEGKVKKTYPAAYSGVLAVAASDRNNERAPFSQAGDFVGVAAPGVEMVSTVPKGGQCVDSGTSFSAPYVAGIAALIRAKHPKWKQNQVVAQIEQTAQRAVKGRDDFIGWGVADPVRALTDDDHPRDAPTPDRPVSDGLRAPEPAALTVGETAQERTERLATYVLAAAVALVAAITGGAVVLRDRRRRAARRA
ncbi:type VII secretion-associated serine protease mycosin [Streptomyces olivoverticillatus]|nr:type VII secretion-associated serine protease mycosin [Streptomyces olivoverticillatus]